MHDDATQNPYLPDELSVAPFAGRQAAFARLHHHVTSAARAQAILFMGRRRMGKTALLRHFDATFDENFVGVYLPLRETPLDSQNVWLAALGQAVADALDQRGFSLNRLSEPTPPDDDARAWLAETYLLDVFAIIRPHRRLILLLDDADALLDAVAAKRLPADTFPFLRSLLEQYQQLGMALTLDARHEDRLDLLAPLVDPQSPLRLTGLTLDESRRLLRQPVMGMYTLSEESIAAIHRAAGGHPYLLQRYGYHLFRYWQTHPDHDPLPESAVKALAVRVYEESEAEFKQVWQDLPRDERLVLTAISSLLYDDPLRKIDAAAVEAWLVETDYPTDMTTINAAIRSLEYDEIVSGAGSGLAIAAGLMQKWLLENARLSEAPASASRARYNLWLIALAVVVVLGLIALALAIPRSSAPDAPIPTVTLPS